MVSWPGNFLRETWLGSLRTGCQSSMNLPSKASNAKKLETFVFGGVPYVNGIASRAATASRRSTPVNTIFGLGTFMARSLLSAQKASLGRRKRCVVAGPPLGVQDTYRKTIRGGNRKFKRGG